MTNFIELNIESPVSSLSMIDNESHFKPVLASLRHFPDEKVDMPSKFIACQDCGITYDIVPISSLGLCKHCAELHQYDNY
jgi:hypothetical protein